LDPDLEDADDPYIMIFNAATVLPVRRKTNCFVLDELISEKAAVGTLDQNGTLKLPKVPTLLHQ
jgi:hypothetical protein